MKFIGKTAKQWFSTKLWAGGDQTEMSKTFSKNCSNVNNIGFSATLSIIVLLVQSTK